MQVNFRTSEINNLTTNTLVRTEPLPQFMFDIIEAGGLVPYLRGTLKKD
jgi:3-isopropylmalate/(R)-2-methylmalate dehydratase small subunit